MFVNSQFSDTEMQALVRILLPYDFKILVKTTV